MADITLRNYLDEIDRMIDGSQVDEAVAHARYILSIFPKHLESYRLLAKALLEKNRHMDAADVFQRVLSSVPDDFVSHVGMAIVREDESNLDAAIWHMERAYEAQPSNGPVQEELRRLYGRRDGMEPPRVRLTRGALARLYEKGDLYPQAIAELRSALVEEPDRLDLKVVMAQALWHAKQMAEAAEVSSKLLDVLPYCREANRILADVWAESGHAAEAQSYRKRLESLDPYEAYADPAQNGSGAANAPADSVRIPHLDYIAPSATETTRPDWMQSLGVQFEQPHSAALPNDAADWLNSVNVPTGAPAPSSAADWMSGPRAGAAAPDWMSQLQGDSGPSALSETPITKQSDANWLNDLVSETPAPGPSEPGDRPTTPPPLAPPLPTGGMGGTATPPAAEAGEPVPDWLASLAGGAAVLSGAIESEPTAAAPEQPAAGEEIPRWMAAAGWAPRDPSIPLDEPNAFAVEEAEPASPSVSGAPAPADELPDWLQALRPPEEPAEPRAAKGETPDWLRAAMEGADETPTGPLKEPATEETPGWLAAAVPATASSLAPNDDVPEWLKPDQVDPDVASFLKGKPTGPLSPRRPTSELPNWLAGEPSAPAPPPSPTGGIKGGPADDLPDWLKPAASQPPADDTISRFLKSKPTGKLALPDSAQVAPLAAEPSTPPAPAAPTSEDEGLAWLEALAMKQGAKEEELITKPESRKSESPDWLRKPREEEETPPESAAAPSATPEGELPDWLRASREAAPAPEPETVDWMRPPTEAAEAEDKLPWEKPAPAAAPPPPALSESTDDQGLAWLEALAMKQGAKEEELVSKPESRSTELPDWLRDSSAQAQPPQPSPAPAAPDWLHDLEAEPQADTAAIQKPAEAEPEPEPEPAPDWMKAPEAAPLASVPDWMQKPAEAEPEPAAPDWMKAPEAAPLASVPDWMKPSPTPEDQTVAYQPGVAMPPATPESEPSAPSMKAVTDWLHPASLDEEEELRRALEAEKPDWLKQMEAESDAYEATLKSPPVPAKPEPDLPDWLRTAADQPTEPTPTRPTMPPSPSSAAHSEDAALAWLEALAVRQGAKEEEFVSDQRVSADDMPQWLRVSSATDLGVPAEPQPGGETVAEPAETALPDWLKAVSEEAPTAPASPPSPPLVTGGQGGAAIPPPPSGEGETKTRLAAKPRRPRPPRPSKSKPAEAPEAVLAAAREHLETSDFGRATEAYGQVIKSGQMLENVIADLEEANEQHPNRPELLRALGDAYMRDNQLQHALDIYKQALQGL